MSDDSRSLVAVLVICAMLMLVCIAVPVGLGAILFVRMQASTQQALTAERAALAAAEQARMQAELARQTAEMQAEQMRKAASAMPEAATPPGPLAGQELTADQRKTIYVQIKLVQDQLAALDALGAEDPVLKEAADKARADFEASLDRIGAAAGISRKQLTEIIAEGLREMW